MELEGKICLIAGSSGAIGAEVSRQFAREGAQLALTYYSAEPVQLRQELASISTAQLRVYRMNSGSWPDVQSVFRAVEADFGALDALVNCTGCYGPIGPVAGNSPQEWAASLHLNVVGCFHLTRAGLESMLKRQRGSIIHFSGGGAAYGRPYFTAYAAAKAAMVRFTESVAAEVREANIRVNAIAPGPVKSRMWEQLRQAGTAAGERALEELRQIDDAGGVPAEHAARLSVFLASDRSQFLTGRLISAIHDQWQMLDSTTEETIGPDTWTLRRVPLGEK